jgi:anaerobic magnesium-protoporphyrin IX monomethyl ester cyclase
LKGAPLATTDKKVLLVYPGRFGEFKPKIPLSLLYLAAVLRENGFACEILDMRVQDSSRCDLSSTLCVGITSMTGPMIGDGLAFARSVRSYDGSIPVVWGGIHPTILPEQTARSELVDAVVRGEGEQTLLELVRKIAEGGPFDAVAGITFQRSGTTVSTPDRPFIDLDMLPPELPYDLLRMDRYDLTAFPVHTSRGCPGKCTFCYNQSFNRGSYRCKSAGKVLLEVDALVNRFNIKDVSFGYEDNFFVSRKRVEDVCTGLAERDSLVEWVACCRFDSIYRYGEEFLELLEASGCRQLLFGGESGSQEILDGVLQKGITVEQMLEVTRRLSKTGIAQTVFFMSGLPTETDRDLAMTMSLIDELARLNPKVTIVGFQIYVPYPGTRLFEMVHDQYGYELPGTLEEWADYKLFRDVKSTWLPRKKERQLKGLTTMAHFSFCEQSYEVPERFERFPYSLLYGLLSRLARWRWRHRFFKWPLEWVLVEKIVARNRGWI